MSFYNDNTDDPIAPDGMASFDGGQYSNARSNVIKPTQYMEGQNLTINLSGEIITRRGTATIETTPLAGFANGITYYQTPSNSFPVQARAGKIYKLVGTTWTQITGYTGSVNAQINFAQGIDKLFWTDGVNHIYQWNGTTLTDLNGGGSPPPTGPKCLVWHTNRLVAAGTAAVPDGVWFSDLLDGATWTAATNMIRVGGGEGDPIVVLVSWTDFNLLVFKRYSIWVVNCDPTVNPDTFTIKRITDRTGCAAARTPRQVGNDVYFLSDTGVRTVQRTLATETGSQLGPAVSEPIGDVIRSIVPSLIGDSAGFYWNNRYFLVMATEGGPALNICAVYNIIQSAWESAAWTNFNARDFCIDHGNNRLLLTDDSKVFAWLDYLDDSAEDHTYFEDNGTAVPVSLTTRAFTFQELQSPKTGLNLELEFNRSIAQVDVYAILDQGAAVLLDSVMSGTGTLTLPATLPFTLPTLGITRKPLDIQSLGPFREIQIQLVADGKMELRSISLNAFVDTLILQVA